MSLADVRELEKTTIARAFARRLPATFLRIDEFEHALRSLPQFLGRDIGAGGYGIAQRLASTKLTLGQHVVADCVIPSKKAAAHGVTSVARPVALFWSSK